MSLRTNFERAILSRKSGRIPFDLSRIILKGFFFFFLLSIFYYHYVIIEQNIWIILCKYSKLRIHLINRYKYLITIARYRMLLSHCITLFLCIWNIFHLSFLNSLFILYSSRNSIQLYFVYPKEKRESPVPCAISPFRSGKFKRIRLTENSKALTNNPTWFWSKGTESLMSQIRRWKPNISFPSAKTQFCLCDLSKAIFTLIQPLFHENISDRITGATEFPAWLFHEPISRVRA